MQWILTRPEEKLGGRDWKQKKYSEEFQIQRLQILSQKWFQDLQMAEKSYRNELVLSHKKKVKEK